MAIYMSEMTKKYQRNDIDGVRKVFSDNIFKVYSVHACLSFYLLINASDIILVTVGGNFTGAIKSLEILSIFSLCHTFGMLSGNLFLSTGRNKLYSSINIVVMLFGGAALIITSYFYKMNAEVLAFVATLFYMLRVFIQLYFNLIFLNLKKSRFIFELIVVSGGILICLKAVHFFQFNLLLNLFVSMCLVFIVNFIFKDYLGISKIFISLRRLS